ncbi:MAG: 50S ribosomal protein L23 [Anaerolineaceae bacterium 4572_78]|nr:MAG: 50S ribosomal protein L23 [Anaerolineaceae bacterium 4572_78]
MAKLNDYQVIIKPILTEKSTALSKKFGQYTFEVDMRANKLQIAEAVSFIFDVDVERVNVIKSIPKFRRWGRKQVQRKSARKKAIVTLAHGEHIEEFGV